MRSLVEAYRKTTFLIKLPDGEVFLRHNSSCHELDQLLAQNRWDYAAVITAFNPGSIERTREENNHANQELEMKILNDGFQIFPGAGQDDDGDWPAEESFLVCGITLNAALKLAEEFGQNAIAFHTIGQETTIELTEIIRTFPDYFGNA
jgi:hypothetical protein